MKRIGRVQEVLVHRDGSRLCGLVLATGSLFHARRVLDFQAVRAVGPTHLLVDEVYLGDETDTCCGERLHGMPVLDHGGEELGTMDDLHFEPSTGRIVALQLSRGFVDDLLGGKGIVAVSGPMTTGEAAIMLDTPEAAEEGMHG